MNVETTSEELTLDEARIAALAKFLECDEDELEASKYDDTSIIVNEHQRLQGTSPDKARQLVALVRRALKIAIDDDPSIRPMMITDSGIWILYPDTRTPGWTTKTFQQGAADNKRRCVPFGDPGYLFPSYNELVRTIRNNPETEPLTKIGLHDLVNTLHFLCTKSDDSGHAIAHRDTLREAFDNLPVTDRRESIAADDGEYLVVTDDEADDLWDESLNNYIDECLEIPEAMANYFDRDAWKSDAKMDGRRHFLSGYDGNENEETVDCTDGSVTFYIYRTS